MSWLRTIVLGCLVAGLLGLAGLPARADDKGKSNKEKLLGTWELVKADAPGAPAGTLVEFTKDGKMKVTATVQGQKVSLEGKYSVEGDMLKTSMTGPDGKEVSDTDTITKITDKELHLKDTKGQKTEFKKK